MKLKPLTGQCLVAVDAPPKLSRGGVALPPDLPVAPAIEEERAHRPEKPAKNNTGRIVAIGPWPKNRKGLAIMPGFGIGQHVLFNPFRGVPMERAIGERLRLIRQEDVLAVISGQ